MTRSISSSRSEQIASSAKVAYCTQVCSAWGNFQCLLFPVASAWHSPGLWPPPTCINQCQEHPTTVENVFFGFMAIWLQLCTLTCWLKQVAFSELDPQNVKNLLQRGRCSNQVGCLFKGFIFGICKSHCLT